MAIIGTHMLFYTSEPEAVRGVLRDVFRWKHVDAGEGWLIFGLPPSEIGVHPAEGPSFEGGARHQITLMCDDIDKTIADLGGKPGVQVKGSPKNEGWGITVMLGLPGGLDVMLYQPRHATAIGTAKKRVSARRATRSAGRGRATSPRRSRTARRKSRR